MTADAEHQEVTVAVVGARGYGRRHLADITRIPGARLSAVADPAPLDGDAAEMAAGVPHYRALADLLAAQRPDIVTIATPIPTHRPLAEEALRAGCDVLLEKPVAASQSDFERLLAVAEETGRSVQIGFQDEGSSAYAAIEELISDGEIGELRGVGACGTWVRSTAYYERAAWAGRRRMDGVDIVDGAVTNPFAHAIQAALRLAGARRAEDVATMEVELFHAHEIEADDTSSLRLLTAEGLPVAAGLTVCATETAEPYVVVHGSAGTVTYWYTAGRVEVAGRSGTRTWNTEVTSLLGNLVAHVREGAALLSPLEASGAFMRVLEAVRRAQDPAPIDPRHLSRLQAPGEVFVQVRDVEQWCARVARELRTFTALGAPWAPEQGALAELQLAGQAVATYVDGAGTAALDGPRPHLHPLRTLGGTVVTDVAPEDHTWHAGVSMAVQDVSGANLWGGATYVRDRGYRWLEDHGRITHEGWLEEPHESAAGGSAVQRLAWRRGDGELLATERRALRWQPAPEGWELEFDSEITAAVEAPLTLGSPGSNGREGGGYGGFFWRLPACTDVEVRTATSRGETQTHGSADPWIAWTARAESDFTLVLARPAGGDGADADRWFVRVSDYPGVGAALAWDTPVTVPGGASMHRSYRSLVADGRLDEQQLRAAGARLAG